MIIMDFLAIRLKPLEPLMLRGPGEFGLSSRGAYTYASSMILPRPSTMLGVLISTLLTSERYVSECMNIGSWGDLLKKCYIKVFNKLGIEALRGPYIVKSDKFFVPIMLRKKLLLLDYNQAGYLLLSEYGDVLEKLLSEDNAEYERTVAILRLVEEKIRAYFKDFAIRPHYISFTGVHLKTREVEGTTHVGKITKEGYIYTATYVSYFTDTEIIFLLMLKNSSEALGYLRSRGAVKFGGESRIAEMIVEHPDENSAARTLLSTLSKIAEARYAILTSPMPLVSDNSRVPLVIWGERTTLGYGFSVAKKRRKPISTSISEGSILRIDASEEISEHEEALIYGLYSAPGLINENKYYRYIGRLGYASFIPLVQ